MLYCKPTVKAAVIIFEKKMKKLRKILSDEQYDLWLTMKPKQPAPHPMPEAGMPVPGEEGPQFDMMQNEAEQE